jgi:hypothetical protein
MTAQTGLDHFLRIVTPEGGSQPEFHFYGARRKGGPGLVAPLPGESVRTFRLADETWPYQVDVFELALPLDSAEIPGALLRGLEGLIAQGAPLAWLMFDAAFDDVTSLTTEWGAQNTYGIAGSTMPPRLALIEEERKADEWKVAIRRVVEGFSRDLQDQG